MYTAAMRGWLLALLTIVPAILGAQEPVRTGDITLRGLTPPISRV